MTVEGFTVEGLAVVFETAGLADEARFPSRAKVSRYEEEEEVE